MMRARRQFGRALTEPLRAFAQVFGRESVYRPTNRPLVTRRNEGAQTMKKILLLAALVAVVAPAAFAAGGGTSPAAACKAQRTAIGAELFRQQYAPTGSAAAALGKCISQGQRAAAANRANAAKECTTERGTTNESRSAFNAKYGANENDRNAFGKCVSAKASEKAAQQQAATIKAAKACKAERGATAQSRAAFKATYGGKANAFAKCVAAKKSA
jgi:hypothetical protein